MAALRPATLATRYAKACAYAHKRELGIDGSICQVGALVSETWFKKGLCIVLRWWYMWLCGWRCCPLAVSPLVLLSSARGLGASLDHYIGG